MHIKASIPLALIALFLLLSPLHAENGHVVINEIKVGGEKATDEFIELYNPTDADVNLTGWRLSKKTASGSLSNLLTEFPSLTLTAHGVVVIAHNDYAGAIPKSIAYSTQSSLTADNTLILYSDNGHTIMDLVGMGSASESEGNAAPTPDPGMSIERKGGVDTNNNAADFIILTTPTPHQSFIESPESNNESQGSGNNGGSHETTSTPQGTASSGILVTFSEVLPNPVGDDTASEWIELVNLTNQEINLADWAVEDASGKHYTIKQSSVISSTTIAPKGYFLLPRNATNISLNNTGTEILRLLNPNEQTIVSISYTGPAQEGSAWARDSDGNYQWSATPTPSASNVITRPEQRPPPPPLTKGGTEEGSPQSSTTSPTPSTTLTVVINELLPNPIGDDTTGEWIELKNEGDDEASLAGFILSDASGASYTFTTQSSPIPPHGLLLLPRAQTKIVLNNDDDTISLSYQGQMIAQAQYGKSEEGISFARDNQGNYAWTTAPTPGKPNIFSLPAETEEEPEEEEKPFNAQTAVVASQDDEDTQNADAPSKPTEPSMKGIRKVAIKDIRSLPRNTNVTIEGVVIVPPGVFGRTSMYLNGIQIYSVAVQFPDCAAGDLVEVRGYVSMSGNETRITVPKTGWVKKIGTGESPEPLLLTAAALSDEQEGSLVQVEGELIEKKSTTLWLDDDTGEVRIVLKNTTGLRPEDFTAGERYTIKGILSETSAGYRVLPRGKDDTASLGTVQGASTQKEMSTSGARNTQPLYYVVTALALIAIALGVGVRKWREHKGISTP
ncbi:MAG: lamin tail domain-containing protein [Patescibacteria group bacterium]